MDTSHGWIRVSSELFHVNRPDIKFPFGSSALYETAAHTVQWRVVGDRDQERLLIVSKATVVLYDLHGAKLYTGVASEKPMVTFFPRANAVLQLVECVSSQTHTYTTHTHTDV